MPVNGYPLTDWPISKWTLVDAAKKYESEILITIGPVIKKDSIRDSVRFIKFNDFVNQLDFADVSRIIKTRVLNEIIGPLDLKNIVGKNVSFYGAITFDRPDKIFITPILIEVN